MNELTASGWEAISVRVGALLAVRDSLLEGAGGAESSAHRLAHAVAGFARHRALSQVAALAAEMEKVEGSEALVRHVDRLVGALRGLGNTTPQKCELVLLVGDGAEWVDRAAAAIESAQREIVVCGTAGDAARVLAGRHVSLLVVDLDLPDGDGRNLLAALADHARPRPAIVVVSPFRDLQPRSECFALGADSYVEKPVEPAHLLATICAELAHAGEVRRETQRDLMTRLPNRRGLAAAFDRLSAIRPAGTDAGSIAMIDLDRFKAINDTFGHQIGDDVLCRTGEVMRRSLGPADLLARWGGEEFVALLPASPIGTAKKALGRTLEAVRGQGFEAPGGRRFHVSFSAGIAPVSGGDSLDDAIRAADRQLYVAKRAGRGRIAVALLDGTNPGTARKRPE